MVAIVTRDSVQAMNTAVISMGILYVENKFHVVLSDDEGRKNVSIGTHDTVKDAKSMLAYYARKAGLSLTLGGCGAEATNGRTVKDPSTFRKFDHRIFF